MWARPPPGCWARPHSDLDNRVFLLAISLVAIWVALGTNLIGMKIGKWTENVGAAATWVLGAPTFRSGQPRIPARHIAGRHLGRPRHQPDRHEDREVDRECGRGRHLGAGRAHIPIWTTAYSCSPYRWSPSGSPSAPT